MRVAGDPMSYASAVEETIHSLNPDLPLFNQTTLKANMRMGNVFERIEVAFAGSFGLLALILAAIGVYGVVAYTTKQRTHEIGIRIALGAGKGHIFRQVLGQGLRLTHCRAGPGTGSRICSHTLPAWHSLWRGNRGLAYVRDGCHPALRHRADCLLRSRTSRCSH